MRAPPLLLAAAAAALAACAPPAAVLKDGSRVTPKAPLTEDAPRLPLTACVTLAAGTRTWVDGHCRAMANRIMSSAVERVHDDDSHPCHVRASYHCHKMRMDVFAADGDELLFTVVKGNEMSGMTKGGAVVYELLKPRVGSLKLVGGAAAPAAAPEAPRPPRPSSSVDVPRYSSPERPDDLAVVIGVEDYSDLPRAAFAARDAEAFAAHARALGVPARNVVLLTGPKAGRAALEKYVEQWLPRLVRPGSRVYFFFSGHGAPDLKTGQAYLVPWDGDPAFLETTAYPLKRLYASLGRLGAKEVLVAMDACFSGAGGRSVLPKGARPLVTSVEAPLPAANVTALTASGPDEISGTVEERAHGAFTYFLLEGLNGAAKDRTAAGLLRYAAPRVQEEARRANRDQTPRLVGDGGLVLY
ncbi:hypothetical protein EPO15_18635 [bacterium]|nr:MAG: hypothetical protein EPO15_18635 [bacterium]